MGRLWVIGDIHGAHRALQQCLQRSGFNREQDHLISLGDVSDGWPETRAVIDKLLKVKNLVHVLGNHDFWTLEWMETGMMEDLGRMHPTEMYARSVAVGPNGKVYVGIGTEKGDLVVYDPATAKHHSILPEGLKGAKGWSTVGVSRRTDGRVYAEFGPNLMRLDDETALP